MSLPAICPSQAIPAIFIVCCPWILCCFHLWIFFFCAVYSLFSKQHSLFFVLSVPRNWKNNLHASGSFLQVQMVLIFSEIPSTCFQMCVIESSDSNYDDIKYSLKLMDNIRVIWERLQSGQTLFVWPPFHGASLTAVCVFSGCPCIHLSKTWRSTRSSG